MPLQRVVDRAVGYVVTVTGQDITAPILPPSLSEALFASLFDQAVQMRTEQVVLQGRKGHLSSAASNSVISSFSAGSYSESHRDPTRRGEEKSINLWPDLDELLWLLMTPDKQDYWRAFLAGQGAPDFVVQQMDWMGIGGAVTFFEPWDRYVPAGYGDGRM